MRASTTIISDASLCPRTGAGGWAAWMVGNGRPSATFSGPLRHKTTSSNEAELLALANALHVAVSKGYAGPGVQVLIQSDSLNALGILLRRVPGVRDRPHPTGLRVSPAKNLPSQEAGRKALAHIKGLVLDGGLSLEVRHVKGHTTGAGRHWVNGTCDNLARTHMQALREA